MAAGGAHVGAGLMTKPSGKHLGTQTVTVILIQVRGALTQINDGPPKGRYAYVS
jgi:hypothetical protein